MLPFPAYLRRLKSPFHNLFIPVPATPRLFPPLPDGARAASPYYNMEPASLTMKILLSSFPHPP